MLKREVGHTGPTTMAALLMTVALWAGLAGIANAEEPPPPAPVPQEEEQALPPETGEIDGAIVAVGAPPVPPTDVIVAVGLPPVPPTDVIVAVGLPPVPPTDVIVAVGKPPVPAASHQHPVVAELPETGSSTAILAIAAVTASVGAFLRLLSQRIS